MACYEPAKETGVKTTRFLSCETGNRNEKNWVTALEIRGKISLALDTDRDIYVEARSA